MRFRHLLLPVLFFLTLCNVSLAQRSGYKPVYAQDSLAGFDEEECKKMALGEGAFGDDFVNFMNHMKRSFINEKYGLNYVEYASFPQDLLNQSPGGKVIGGGNLIFAAPCVNEGFESGNINGWTCTGGANANSCTYPTTGSVITFPTASLITTSVTPFTDPFYGFNVPNSPLGGSVVVRMNDNFLGTSGFSGFERVKLTSGQFNVTATNFLYEFAYMMVAATQHTCCQQPYMRVNLLNNLGSPISCPLFTIAPPPPSGPTCSSPGITWVTSGSIRRNPTWQRYAIDLTSYIGSNVAIEVNVSNCSLGGHFGYAYFDSNCGELGFTLNGTTFYSAPSGTVNIPATCGGTASLTAPTGLGPYTWNGPSGSGITNSTLQTIVTSVAGNYSISMNPPGICAPITRVINLSFPPPTTLTANPATICASGPPSSSTLSITGAANYTWSTGSNASAIVVSPTATTIYSVTVQTGTCIGTRTIQVEVSPNPTITVSNPNPNICAGGSVTMTANGANNYTWNPGALTGSQVVVSPTTPGNNVYTVTGANSAGCVDTETTIVSVGTSTSITIFNITGSVCAGNPVMLVAATSGYATFTWQPTNPMVTGNPGIVTPTATTVYTVLAGAGSCTNTATITVIADQGPTMTVSASPTITCPGVNATLSAIAPSAIGSLTWNPGAMTGTSVVVNPTTSTVYSVTGRNANTCPRTYTINKLVAPSPTIVFAPASPSVCIGSALTLTASGGTSYTWTPAPVVNTATRVVTPTVNTTYSVAVSNGSCTSNANITVSVVPTPTVTASASPTAICRGSSATLTANGATSYTWQPGSLTGSSTVVSPSVTTTYTVTGNSAGCTDTETVTVVVNPLPVVTVTASPPTICRGSCSTLTPGGAQTYTIQPGFSNIVCPTVTTTYSVTGTSSLGCVSANPATLNIVVNNTPNITFLPSSPTLCAGGTVAVTAIGGTQYTWQPGNLTGNSQTLSPAATTVYTVTARNAFACTSQRTLNVTVLPTPTVTAAANPSVLCSGSTTTLSASGATSYTWNPGNLNGATVAVTPTATTTYTVRGATGNCSGSSTVLVTVNPTPTITASASPTAICTGETGTLSASGATSYTWMPGALTGANVTVSPSGNTTYTVTGTSSGCSSTATVALTVNPNPTITASASPSTICRGSCSTITPAGAQTYTILPGFSNVVCPTVTTTYSITGTSSAGCVSSQARTLSIVVNNTPNIIFLPSSPTVCPGRTVQVTAIGGISYTWNPGNLSGNSQILSPSVTTVYTVTAANAFGCTGQRTVAVTVRPSPTITVAANPATVCPAACSTLTPSGALTYTYSSGSNVVCPTVTTTYSVNGTNNFGCVSTTPGTVTVNVSPPPTLSFSPSSPSICAGSSVNVTASGANAYTWNPGNLTGASQNLAPGATTTYTVSGSNAAGCVGQGTVTVTVIPTPTVGASASPATICQGATAVLTATGAASYTWQPGGSTSNPVNVTPSVTTIYTVTGSTSGCTGTRTVAVTVTPLPTITAAASPSNICMGNSSTVTANGATTYTWSTGASGASIVVSPTANTVYTVTGTSGGCNGTRTVAVNVSPLPFVFAVASPTAICPGNTATLSAAGGISYTWQPGSLSGPNVTVSPLVTTLYTVSASDGTCVGTRTVNLVVNPSPTVGASASPSVICRGNSSTLTATGAAGYSWNPGGISGNPVSVNPTVTTIYTVTGTSAAGCSGTRTVQVTVNPTPTIAATANPASVCPGFCSTLTASGAQTYTYSSGSNVVCPTVTTTYSVSGTSSLGCVSTTPGTVAVVVNPTPTITLTILNATICAGGTVNINAVGAISYTWMPGNLTGSTQALTPAATTVYTVTGANAQGCTGQRTTTITVVPNPTVNASASPSIICRGSSSTLSATGATSYVWNPGGISGNPIVVSPTATTIYTVIGTGAAGCSGTRTVAVNVNPQPTISAAASPSSLCPGACATITPSGAQTYTYSSGSNVVCPTVTTTYSVSGTSSLGCVSAVPATVAVVVNPVPTISLSPSSATICAGGTVNVIASGGVSYTWNPGNLSGTSQVLSPAATTVYTVTGANAQGCTGQRTIAINVTPNPTVNASASPATICSGASSTLSATGAAGYTWMPGGLTGASVSVSPTITTTYTVTGTTSGCPGTRTVLVTVNPQPTITVSSGLTAGICPGTCATLTPSGAQTYTYLNGGPVVCPSVTTTYSVSGTSAFGCVSANAGTVTILVNPVPSITLTASSGSVCAGSAVTITASGAGNYTWMPGGLGGTVVAFTPTATTTYTVLGRLSPAACTGQNTITIIVLPNPTITASPASTAICLGSSATLTANGATTYTWMPGNLSGAAVAVSPTATTVYTVMGSSGGCNSLPASVTVSVSTTIAGTAAVTPTAVCSSGCATLSLTGYTGTIQWQSNVIGPVGPWLNISGANTSTYVFCGITATRWFQAVVTTTCGSIASNVVQVTLNPSPAVSVTPNPAVVCAGSTVALTASGGSTYTWSPATGLSCTNCANPVAGPASTTNYTVTAASAQGCTSTAAVVVSVVPNPTVNASASPAAICSGATSTLSATGAASFTWNPGGLTGSAVTVTPSSTTIYTVTGTSGACSDTRTLQLTVNPLPTITPAASPASVCPGFCATLTASGAQTYTYLNGGPVVCPTVTSTYSVSGTSSLGCTSAAPGMITVVVNPVPVVSITPASASICAGSSVNVTASGGTSYTWNPGGLTGASQQLSPSASTVYTVTAVNAQGCSAQETITISVSPVPVVSASASSGTICSGDSSTLTATGAGSYTWTPGGLTGNSIVVSPAASTIYTVSGSSAGCNGTSTVAITVNPLPTITAVASPTAGCPGFCSTITASGAQTYTYSSGSNVVCPTVTATYSVSGTDANGCVSASPALVTIVLNPNPSLAAAGSPTVLCDGQTATLSATGATNYTWMPGSFNTASVAVTPTASTIYTVTGDNGNCSIDATVAITVNPNPTLNVSALPASICNNGTSTLSASGATGYTWMPVSLTGGTISVSPTITTVYTVTADNLFGCIATETVAVSVGSLPTLTITGSSNTICAGASATLTASGTLTYTWNPGNLSGSSVTVSPNVTTTYTITGSNGPGCTNTETFALVVSPIPSITASVSTNPVCEGFPTNLSASGATSYTWYPGSLTGSLVSVSPTITTTYTVDGDALGCVASTVITVSVLPLPPVVAAASPTAVCTGNSLTLSATGANSYTWLPMSVTGATVADTPTSTTTYTVIGLGANGCPNADTITVFVLPPPTINATASGTAVCLGSTATLIATGAVTYTWEPGSLTGDTVLVSPGSPTTYTVTGDNGACTGTAVVSIGINPLPTVTAVSSTTVVCEGLPVTFTASGANNYTWNPNGQTGPVVTENPTVNITYTVTGEDANGCTNTAQISVSVNPSPTMIAIANPASLCEGDSVVLTGSGAPTLTWNPTGLTTQTIVEFPAATTVYTLSGTDPIGCVGSATVQVSVFPTPTVVATPSVITICAGTPATLTATGATNYSWMPGGATGSVAIETPTANTTYTVTGDNGGTCFHTATVDVFVNPLPANVTATVTGTITCSSPTVDLFGSSTDTNVSYAWAGPQGYTSAVQNPTGVTVWGTFTLSVTDNSTGCTATATVDVATDNSVPLVTASASGSITCSVSEVTLNAVHTTTNPGYSWTGPGSFTAAAQSVTVGAAGQYTVVVTDLSSSCSASAVVTVGTHTSVSITATIVPATCTAGVSNNDGTIMTSGFGTLDKFDLVAGTSYTGSATYSTAITIPGNGIVTSNLANPTTTAPYTLRLFDSEGCVKDTTLYLIPVDCSLRSLGIAKAVSTPSLNSDNSYDVVYTISVKNYDTAALTEVVLTENLSATFPAPATYSVVSVNSSGAGSLVVNAGFNGGSDPALTTSASAIAANTTYSLELRIRVVTNGVFGPYNNSVSGSAVNNISVAVTDVSTEGLDPDPDTDNNPKNNSVPTVLNFSPNLFFGLTKEGSFMLTDNNSYDVTYTITIHNRGNDTLRNVTVNDSLFNNTIRYPATYTMKSAPVATGSLAANASFNGNTDIRLLNSAASIMRPGEVSTIVFAINVVPDTVTVVSNSAAGRAVNVTGGTQVTDISNAGSNPDSNSNGIWNEAEDNVPTVLILPLLAVNTPTLFIPGGFSPDGDGVNDVFVIKGLPKDAESSITIFNRWGNRVYQHANYAEAEPWDGTPNIAGTMGRNKLPQGTYYYVLDIKGSGMKPITGFIVLQY